MLVSAVFIYCLLLVAFKAGTSNGGLAGKSLRFPTKTSDSYVKILPDKPLDLKAFTLCMRVSAEQIRNRGIILFAYHKSGYDEFNAWKEKNGSISFYLHSNDGAIFGLPPLTSRRTHLCFTWDPVTGLSTAWVDGRCSAFKSYRKGHFISPGGVVLLGQDPDSYLDKFDKEQSFVGEITDVKLWDYVIPANMIKAVHDKDEVKMANIFDWNTIKYEIYNNVLVVMEDFCLRTF